MDKPQGTTRHKHSARSLLVFLTTCSIASFLLYAADHSGLIQVLSWSIGAGVPTLIAILICMTIGLNRGESLRHTGLTTFLVCLPMFLDFTDLTLEVFVVTGVALTVIGCTYVHITIRTSSLARYGFWLISAYILSTYIFNALYVTYGHMSFFDSGYTR